MILLGVPAAAWWFSLSCFINEKVTKFILNINLSLSFSRLETWDNPEPEDKSNWTYVQLLVHWFTYLRHPILTNYKKKNNNNNSLSSSINLFLGGLGSTPKCVWAHVCRIYPFFYFIFCWVCRIYLPFSFIHLAINK